VEPMAQVSPGLLDLGVHRHHQGLAGVHFWGEIGKKAMNVT
jgi:hypothetical protein